MLVRSFITQSLTKKLGKLGGSSKMSVKKENKVKRRKLNPLSYNSMNDMNNSMNNSLSLTYFGGL